MEIYEKQVIAPAGGLSTRELFGEELAGTQSTNFIADFSLGSHRFTGRFSRLEKVVMCNCGVSNEDMDALNKKYEDVRFVWSVRFSIWTLRTDATNSRYSGRKSSPRNSFISIRMPNLTV